MNLQTIQLPHNGIADFMALLRIFEQVFEWEDFSVPSETHLQKLLADPRFLVWVAKANNMVVGGLTIHVLQSYTTQKPSAYIYDVGVTQAYQRQGIGKLLIAAATTYCQKQGFSELFVQAETADTHAVDFYRATPITNEMQATHFTYTLDGHTKSE